MLYHGLLIFHEKNNNKINSLTMILINQPADIDVNEANIIQRCID